MLRVLARPHGCKDSILTARPRRSPVCAALDNKQRSEETEKSREKGSDLDGKAWLSHDSISLTAAVTIKCRSRDCARQCLILLGEKGSRSPRDVKLVTRPRLLRRRGEGQCQIARLLEVYPYDPGSARPRPDIRESAPLHTSYRRFPFPPFLVRSHKGSQCR